MKSILSQHEVDELLSDFQDETYNVERAREHKLTKDDVKTVRQIHELLAHDLADKLSVLLHTEVKITLFQIKKRPASVMQIMDELSVLSGCFEFNSPQLPEVYTFDVKLAYSMIEHLLGGDGRSVYYSPELTEIEKRIFGRVDDVVIESMQTKWKQYRSTSVIKKIECDDHSDNTSQTDVISVMMQVSLGRGAEGQLKFHYQLPSLLAQF